jgi:hypothetical protein
MKRIFTFSIIFLLFSTFTLSQQNVSNSTQKSFSVFFDYPIFFRTENGTSDYHLITANLEYLLNPGKKSKSLISLGYGTAIYKFGQTYSDMAFAVEFNKLWGSKNHFFESGIALNYISDFLLKFRFGYRLVLWEKWLVRVGYTPYVWIDNWQMTGFNNLSLSIGYTFGNSNVLKNVWNRILGIQLNSQPLYHHWEGLPGHLEIIDLELLIVDFENSKLIFSAGYGWAKVTEENEKHRRPHLEIKSFGLHFLKGKKHYIESGFGFSFSDKYHFMLQPQLGYRFHFWKRFMARAAYSPYWWLISNPVDKANMTKPFVQSATIGLGFRFH